MPLEWSVVAPLRASQRAGSPQSAPPAWVSVGLVVAARHLHPQSRHPRLSFGAFFLCVRVFAFLCACVCVVFSRCVSFCLPSLWLVWFPLFECVLRFRFCCVFLCGFLCFNGFPFAVLKTRYPLVITVEVITLEMGPGYQKAKNTIGPDLKS